MLVLTNKSQFIENNQALIGRNQRLIEAHLSTGTGLSKKKRSSLLKSVVLKIPYKNYSTTRILDANPGITTL